MLYARARLRGGELPSELGLLGGGARLRALERLGSLRARLVDRHLLSPLAELHLDGELAVVLARGVEAPPPHRELAPVQRRSAEVGLAGVASR